MNIFLASLGSPTVITPKSLMVIINGESNSGGYALNSEAPGNEVGVRSSVSLLNPVSLVFESLNIGGNNLLDHAGLSNGSTHGFELELANRADTLPFYEGVKLIKTGHGGSMISQWGIGNTYFNKFEDRIDAAKSFVDFNNYNICILFSLGINDAISGTNVNTWKSGIVTHFANMRSYIGMGDIPIVMTQFQGMGSGGTQYSSYNTAIQEICASQTNVFSIDVSGAGLRDANHWNYSGMKQVAGDLLDVVELYY